VYRCTAWPIDLCNRILHGDWAKMRKVLMGFMMPPFPWSRPLSRFFGTHLQNNKILHTNTSRGGKFFFGVIDHILNWDLRIVHCILVWFDQKWPNLSWWPIWWRESIMTGGGKVSRVYNELQLKGVVHQEHPVYALFDMECPAFSW